LVDFFKKSFPLKPLGQMNWNLVRTIYRRFCIKFPQSRMKDEWCSAHWASNFYLFHLIIINNITSDEYQCKFINLCYAFKVMMMIH
jgi:hypothetical protein